MNTMLLRTTLSPAKKSRFAGLLVAAVAFLVYANSLGNGFVWDDMLVIVGNPALNGDMISMFNGIDSALDTEINPYYRPVALSTFLVEKRLHNHNALYMHLLNILLHSVNAFLVFLLALTLTGSSRAAVIAGLFFAVHPIHTECVDFISARNGILSATFVLGAYLTHEQSIRKDQLSFAVGGAFLFLGGLFSKETAAAVLLIIGCREITLFRRNGTTVMGKGIARFTPYLIALLIYLVLRSNALSAAGARLQVFPGLLSRLLDNIYIIPSYLIKVLFPASLSPIYAVPEDLHLLALPLFFGWSSILGILWWVLAKSRTSTTIFGLAWVVAFWLPVSGIIAFPSAPMADRYLYLPAIGLWIVIADQIIRWFPEEHIAHRHVIMAVIAILIVYSGMTIRRNLDWKNDITLFSRVVQQFPEDARGHAELGRSYYKESRRDEDHLNMAEREFQTALKLDPSMKTIHTPLGSICLMREDFDGALSHYTEALAAYPFDKEALIYRGIVLEQMGRNREAVKDYQLFLASPGRGLAEMRPYAEARIRENAH